MDYGRDRRNRRGPFVFTLCSCRTGAPSVKILPDSFFDSCHHLGVKSPLALLTLFLLSTAAFAQSNKTAKRFPAPGISVPESIRSSLGQSLESFQQQRKAVESKLLSEQERALLPDILIYEKAVRFALSTTNSIALMNLLRPHACWKRDLNASRHFQVGRPPGSQQPGLLCAGTKAELTVQSSLMAWSSRQVINRKTEKNIVWMSGFMVAMKL